MPFWRTTANIFTDLGEHFDENWMDRNSLVTPEKRDWDYMREMTIEDVNIWEEIKFNPQGIGLWASWDPYAEFYMITDGKGAIETYYGQGAQAQVQKRMKDLNAPVILYTHWVEPEDMWLHQPKEIVDLIL